MNVVIPMAGEGSRFSNVGYQYPKPFIPIRGKAMIEWVIDNVSEPDDKVYLLSKLDHLSYVRDTNILSRNNTAIMPVLHKTEGALCTILLAERFIDTEEPLLIANSDQYVPYDKSLWRQNCSMSDGCIMVFEATESKWSFVEVSETNKERVVKVAEKVPISNLATIGLYYFHSGKAFVEAAKTLITNNDRVNGEFYLVPVYNYYIQKNPDVRIYKVNAAYGMGTPEDLEKNYDKIGT